jgi:hypothetical protein
MHRDTPEREETLMARVAISSPTIETLADLLTRLGDIPLERIRFRPAPETATEKDVIDFDEHENGHLELVIDPKTPTVHVPSARDRLVVLRASQVLDGADVLADQVIPVRDLFDLIQHDRKT